MARKSFSRALTLLIAFSGILRFDVPRHDVSEGKQLVLDSYAVLDSHRGWFCHLSSVGISQGRHTLRPAFDYSKSHAANSFEAGCRGHKSLTTLSLVADSGAISPSVSLYALQVKLQV